MQGRKQSHSACWGQVSPTNREVRCWAERQANSLARAEEKVGEGRTLKGEIATVQAGHERGRAP